MLEWYKNDILIGLYSNYKKYIFGMTVQMIPPFFMSEHPVLRQEGFDPLGANAKKKEEKGQGTRGGNPDPDLETVQNGPKTAWNSLK